MSIDINKDNPGYGNNPNIFGGYMFKSKYGDIPAYCLDTTREFIKKIMKETHNGIFVEIGVFGGSTLLDIYDVCKTNNNKIYGIDPFDEIKIFNGINFDNTDIIVRNQEINRYKNIKLNLMNIIEKHKLTNINLLCNTSDNVCNLFENNSIDCIHIDGDHSYNGVKNDLELYWNKIKSGGHIINDDYHWNGVKKAVIEFMEKNNDLIQNSYQIQNGEKNVIIKK